MSVNQKQGRVAVRGLCLQIQSPASKSTSCAQSEPQGLVEQSRWNSSGPTPLGDITLHAEYATRPLLMKVRRDKWTVREEELRWPGRKEGDRVAQEAPTVLSQTGVILEQSICCLQARQFLHILCIFLALSIVSKTLWGENSVSVQ